MKLTPKKAGKASRRVMAAALVALSLPALTGCIDDKYDLLRHPCIRFTEDGGAPSYDYTAAGQAADDLPGDAANWKLLDMDDFLPQVEPPRTPFRTIQNKEECP